MWAVAADSNVVQRGNSALTADHDWVTAMEKADLLVLSIFNTQPQNMARRMVRRIRRNWPGAQVVLALWNAPAVAANPEFAAECGAHACVTSLQELQLWVQALQAKELSEGVIAAPLPEGDALRVQFLHASGVLDTELTPLYHEAAQQAVNAFNTRWAQVAWVDESRVFVPGGLLIAQEEGQEPVSLARDQSICSYVVYDEQALVIGDLARDPRFAGNPDLQKLKLRFYAGVPLSDKKGNVLGCFSIMDDEPRNMSDEDMELLHSMAQQLMDDIREARKHPAAGS